jgi:sialate O-acetylesterase
MRLAQLLPLLITCCWGLHGAALRAEVSLSAVFSDHMVLQREHKNRVWGRAERGEQVTVKISDQEHTTTADEAGRWQVTLSALPAGGPHQLEISGKNSLTISDVLVGEVWICSGQSNMEWPVEATNDGDLEQALPPNAGIRFITVPHAGTQQPQESFKGQWEICDSATKKQFSAVGYFFGKQLAETLDVPVGLIDDSWGGSACEAWIDRKLLANHKQLKGLNDAWNDLEKTYDYRNELNKYEEQLKTWESNDMKTPAPRRPWDLMTGNARPGNLYNGMLTPIIGYGVRGTIWYQGETNAERSYQYREMFPLMIQNWRDAWQIGDFSFYWAQLADFNPEATQPSDCWWAELREAQTMTLDKLPNVGQAVIIDIGEGKDIHPRNKRDVGLRLARIALAKDYGIDILFHSPRFKSLELKDGKAIITFDIGKHAAGKLRPFDLEEPVGFAIAGVDRKFVYGHAKLVSADRLEVWNDAVPEPVAVRYAWADNPVCNLKNEAGLPVIPFRTDDWPGITADNELPSFLKQAVH